MISDLNFHLTIRTILQGENFLFSKENEDTYNPTTNGDSFVFFFIGPVKIYAQNCLQAPAE